MGDQPGLMAEAVIPFKALPATCIVVDGRVYDLGDFKHPGGAAVLAPVMGHDATHTFDAHHSRSLLALVPCVGLIASDDPDWRKDFEAQKQLAEVWVSRCVSLLNLDYRDCSTSGKVSRH